jgi:hypothetical protein
MTGAAGSLVPYARFLEIRERRQRLTTELTPVPTDPASEQPAAPADQMLIIDCVSVGDGQSIARSILEASRPDDRAGRDR